MYAIPTAVLVSCLLASPPGGDSGLVSLTSSHDVPRTVERLEGALKAKEIPVIAKVDHSAGAAKVGEELRPTVLLVFGAPKLGTPLLKCAQTTGIDLPLKALAWEDESGQTRLTYNAPRYVASRHGVAECGDVLRKMAAALEGLAKEATRP